MKNFVSPVLLQHSLGIFVRQQVTTSLFEQLDHFWISSFMENDCLFMSSFSIPGEVIDSHSQQCLYNTILKSFASQQVEASLFEQLLYFQHTFTSLEMVVSS